MKLITVNKVKIPDAKQKKKKVGNRNVIPVFAYNYQCSCRF